MTVYHYTDVRGLVGILTSKKIWATDIRFLNDAKEMHYALDVVGSAIKKLLESGESTDAARAAEVLNRWRRLQHVTAGMDGPYIVAFSKHPDRLSQWRGYAGPAGYALGFEVHPPEPVYNPPEWELVACRYGTDGLAAEAQSAFEEWPLTEPRTKGEETAAFKEFFRWLDNMAPLVKDESFEEEGEWRLLVRQPAVEDLILNFRPGSSLPIPYYEIPFVTAKGHELLTLREVIVGPAVDQRLAEMAITDLLTEKGLYDSVDKLLYSAIPFREL